MYTENGKLKSSTENEENNGDALVLEDMDRRKDRWGLSEHGYHFIYF